MTQELIITSDQARIGLENLRKNSSFFKIDKSLFHYLNKNLDYTLFLTELMDKESYFLSKDLIEEKGSWFFLIQSYIEKSTGLSPFKQNEAVTFLEKSGLLQTKLKGLPCRKYYKINHLEILKVYLTQQEEEEGSEEQQFLSNFKTSSQHVSEQVLNPLEPINNNKDNKNKENHFFYKKMDDPDGSCLYPPDPLILRRRKEPPLEKTRRQILTEKINNSIPIIEKEMKDKAKKERKEKQEKNKNEPVIEIPKDVQFIFDTWEKNGFTICPPNNRTLNHTIRLCKNLLGGKLPMIKGFSPFPGMGKVVEAIERYRLAAFEKEYYPGDPKKKKDLQKKTLADFILNYPGNSLLSKYNNDYEPSLLPQYKNHVEDLWPNGTKQIMSFYREHARGTLKEDFSVSDIDKFRKASNLCKEFWDKHKYQIRGISGYQAIAEYLCKAVWESCGQISSKLYTGSFCTPFAKDRMIAKLSEEGLITESDMGRTNVHKKRDDTSSDVTVSLFD